MHDVKHQKAIENDDRSKLQYDLLAASRWAERDHLELNEEKLKLIRFGRENIQ